MNLFTRRAHRRPAPTRQRGQVLVEFSLVFGGLAAFVIGGALLTILWPFQAWAVEGSTNWLAEELTETQQWDSDVQARFLEEAAGRGVLVDPNRDEIQIIVVDEKLACTETPVATYGSVFVPPTVHEGNWDNPDFGYVSDDMYGTHAATKTTSTSGDFGAWELNLPRRANITSVSMLAEWAQSTSSGASFFRLAAVLNDEPYGPVLTDTQPPTVDTVEEVDLGYLTPEQINQLDLNVLVSRTSSNPEFEARLDAVGLMIYYEIPPLAPCALDWASNYAAPITIPAGSWVRVTLTMNEPGTLADAGGTSGTLRVGGDNQGAAPSATESPEPSPTP